MKINLKGFFSVLACVFVLFVVINDVSAAQQSGGQNIGVTVDNGPVVVPETPVIIRSQNIGTNTLDLVVKVGDGFASETLDFVVTVTNVFTGDVTNINFTQSTNVDAQSILAMSGLDPGTEYQFTVRYARPGDVYSAESNIHTAVTIIESPVLNSIDNITTDSADLDVIIDPDLIGKTMDFIVEVKNESGDVYTIQITKYITSSHVTINVDGLDSDTGYTFKVKYAHENTTYFSGYSNEKSFTTESESGTETPDKPVIEDIINITTSSLDLVVKTKDHENENLDFVVRVTNIATGATFTIDFSEKTSGDGIVLLGIGGLEPGTEYEFKVRYALKDESTYSSYSNSRDARTRYVSADGEAIICYNDATITVAQSDVQYYLDRGASTGECNIVGRKINVCHNGQTILIDESALQAHLNQGYSIGKCVENVMGGGTDVDGTNDETTEFQSAMISIGDSNGFKLASVFGAAAGAIALISALAMPILSAMPGSLSGTIFLKIIELFGIIGKRKEDQNWGVVFDSDTRMPLIAVKIVLFDEFGKELATTYSNRDGRFGFLAKPGTYMIHVFKRGYTLFTDKTHDQLYGNVYDGKNITVDSDNVILINLSMKSDNMNWQEYSGKRIKQYKTLIFMNYLFFALYVFGFGATIIITFFYPTTFNFIVLSIYIVLFAYRLLHKKKKYGSIETGVGEPVPFAVVNLYEQDSKEKHNFAVTDAIGKYYLLADNGSYDLKAKGQPVSGVQFEKYGDVDVNDGVVRKDIVV